MKAINELTTAELMKVLQDKKFGLNIISDVDKLLDAVYAELDARFEDRGQLVRVSNLTTSNGYKCYVLSKIVDGITISTYNERDLTFAKSIKRAK